MEHFGSSLRFGYISKTKGKTTSVINALDAQAPAQKWGPAPNAIDFEQSLVISNLSGSENMVGSRFAAPNIKNMRSSTSKVVFEYKYFLAILLQDLAYS